MLERILVVARLILLPVLASASGSEPGEQFTSPLGFHFGKATLKDIQAKLGPTALGKSGDAGNFLARICYALPDSKIFLEFMSGALGGAEHDLLGFRMREVSGKAPRQCLPLLRSIANGLDLAVGGLRLGMGRSEFEKVLSLTSDRVKPITGRRFQRRERLSADDIRRLSREWPGVEQDPYYDVSISVEGKFAGDRLVELEIWKTKTL